MKSKIFLFALILFPTLVSLNQMPKRKKLVDDFNRRIDQAVVDNDFKSLKEWYADDFVFTHGSGHIDSRKLVERHRNKLPKIKIPLSPARLDES